MLAHQSHREQTPARVCRQAAKACSLSQAAASG